ncbi:hypothetical protein [Microbacterium sp. NPDC076911]|uniref:hypothetical protein n=1 Tax=Microbacterium sp. NPDC076911 TaxID=3154958 RepID=UPI003440350B
MRVRLFVAASVLGASALVITGCANPLEQLVQGGIQEGIEQVVEEAAGGDVDFDVDAGGGASVPDSFPSDVPLPPGDLMASFSAAGSYQLTYSIDSLDQVSAFADSLIADGYEVVSESDMGEMKIWALQNDKWLVTLGSFDAEGESGLSYTVSPVEG